MKIQFSKRRNRALTKIDVLVIIAIVLILAAVILWPVLVAASGSRLASRMQCIADLNQAGQAFNIWAGDNNGKYPMGVSATNGGAMESVATGDVVACFRIMSNELSTPKILVCPVDSVHTSATNWGGDFNSSHVSYFISADADKSFPQRLLSGDDNFVTNGVLAKSGLFEFPSKEVLWGPGRHGDVPRHFWTTPPAHFVGNISFSDGSVSEVSDLGLEQALVLGLATNRFAIP